MKTVSVGGAGFAGSVAGAGLGQLGHDLGKAAGYLGPLLIGRRGVDLGIQHRVDLRALVLRFCDEAAADSGDLAGLGGMDPLPLIGRQKLRTGRLYGPGGVLRQRDKERLLLKLPRLIIYVRNCHYRPQHPNGSDDDRRVTGLKPLIEVLAPIDQDRTLLGGRLIGRRQGAAPELARDRLQLVVQPARQICDRPAHRNDPTGLRHG